MKKPIICLLFLATLLQAFSKVVIYIDFKLNQTYIANTLCENRDRPQLHCNGKCQLSKQLKKDEENSKESKKSIQESIYDCPCFGNRLNFAVVTFITDTDKDYPVYTDPVLQAAHQRVFHPPNAIV